MQKIEYSAKYAAGGQMGIIINKANNESITAIYEYAKEFDKKYGKEN